MKGNKEYRFIDNPKEKEFHDKFISRFNCDGSKSLSALVNGWSDDRQNLPKEWLSEKEEDICVSLIQWLGSPTGQGFLAECGFTRRRS